MSAISHGSSIGEDVNKRAKAAQPAKLPCSLIDEIVVVVDGKLVKLDLANTPLDEDSNEMTSKIDGEIVNIGDFFELARDTAKHLQKVYTYAVFSNFAFMWLR